MGTVVNIEERAIKLAEHIDFGEVLAPPVEPVNCSLSQLIRRLEALVGADRWSLQKVRQGDYEARTWDGSVGRGMTATDAVHDLVGQLGAVRHAA